MSKLSAKYFNLGLWASHCAMNVVVATVAAIFWLVARYFSGLLSLYRLKPRMRGGFQLELWRVF